MYSDARPGMGSDGLAGIAPRRWYRDQPWLIGANYVPASAANQLDMWHAATFDPPAIDRELGWAADLGMNTMRAFLTDLLWEDDAEGFLDRIDALLGIADRHGIRPLLVLFDSCWHPEPSANACPVPERGVHNSAWLQSPGERALRDRDNWPRLERYVTGVARRFARDTRILGWDIWNEPGKPGNPHRPNADAAAKTAAVAELLPLAFGWVRAQHPASR